MSKGDRGLGRGFESLIPTEFDASLLVSNQDRVQNVLISDIEVNTQQPRSSFDDESLNELAISIRRYGILQPIIISPLKNSNSYSLVAGERRWRAAQKAGLTKIPSIIRARQELEKLEIALIENVQRVDLSPLDLAVSIEKLHQHFNLTYESIANRMGKPVSTLHNVVRLLQLPKEAMVALERGDITEGHARAIVALKEMPHRQSELLNEIIKRGISVRQAEQFVKVSKEGISDKKTTRRRLASETPLTRELAKTLKTPVSLRRTAHGGRLEIHFKNEQELEELIDRLRKHLS